MLSEKDASHIAMLMANASFVVRYSMDLNGYKTARYRSTVMAVKVRHVACTED